MTGCPHLGTHGADRQGDIVAVAQYAAWPEASQESAEVAFVVDDSWQYRGIGSALAAEVVERVRANGFTQLTASTFGENAAARSLLARLGFRLASVADGILSYRLALGQPLRRAA